MDNPRLRPAPKFKLPALSDIRSLWKDDFEGKTTSSHKKVARTGYIVILATFGVLGIWAATARLDSAVIAQGIVSVESNRKTVQHLEGGIVRRILVREGERVSVGQTLFEMDKTQATASLDIAHNQLTRLLAKEARLVAERDDLATIPYSGELVTERGRPDVAQAIGDEEKQFAERRGTIRNQVDLYNTRIATYETEIEGLNAQLDSLNEQVRYLDDEIVGLQKLYDQDLVPKPRLLAMQRERASAKGNIGRLISDKSKAAKGIAEGRLQIRQMKQQFYEQVSKDLTDTRTSIGDIREKYTVAEDTAQRIDVKSPATGITQNLRVFTNGAVVRPGEPMIDVVPEAEGLIVQSHVSVTDVDSVHKGMKAEVRFPAFHSRTLPVISGVVDSVSGDRLVDEATHQPYFLALIRVPSAQLPKELRGKLQPGMPAEVIVPTGERTVLQYIWSPLTNALRTTAREE